MGPGEKANHSLLFIMSSRPPSCMQLASLSSSCTLIQDLLADYTCQCPSGYSGRNCGIVDDCAAAGVECPGNSTCIDGVDSFECVCNHGFEGENCTGRYACSYEPR